VSGAEPGARAARTAGAAAFAFAMIRSGAATAFVRSAWTFTSALPYAFAFAFFARPMREKLPQNVAPSP